MNVTFTVFVFFSFCVIVQMNVRTPNVRRLGTLNINGVFSATKQQLLQRFLHVNDLDLLFLQEVTFSDFGFLANYNAFVNVGTCGLGTAIILKKGITVQHQRRLLSGRGISLVCDNILYVNVYAPSGFVHRHDREDFFNANIVPLFSPTHDSVVLGGDFNCFLYSTDTTGSFNKCNALDLLIQQLQFTDVWRKLNTSAGYTYVTSTVKSRLDRLYVSKPLVPGLSIVQVVVAPFSDHAAVVMTFTVQHKLDIPYGRSFWKLPTFLLFQPDVKFMFKRKWLYWCKQQKFFPSLTLELPKRVHWVRNHIFRNFFSLPM